jgi:putative iron-dependent peroxidase
VHIQPIRHFCWNLSMKSAQPGILAPVPPQGRYLFFTPKQPSALGEALTRLAPLVDGPHAVVGIGPDVVAALGATVPGLHPFVALKGPGVEVPATPTALWCWLRGTDRGKLVHATRAIEKALAPALRLERAIEAFRHGRGPNGHGRDLTGYEDGTENPENAAAEKAALAHRQGAGLNGSSFVAVQQWLHDLDAFERMGTREQDNMVGRRRRDNHELDDAPASAHVKRTAQESFKPEAFVLRRSMPWAAGAPGRADVRGLRQVLRRLRGADAAHGGPGRRHRRCDVPDFPAGHRRLFLVPAGAPGRDGHAAGPAPSGPVTRMRERLHLYLDLIRWNRPAGWLLLLWPTLSALWIAAGGFPGWHLLAVFTLGTILMRSAGCCINDVADREFDRHVKRTAQRPVTSGKVG